MRVVETLLLALWAACAAAAATTARDATAGSEDEPGWRAGVVYTFRVQTRTLAGLDSPPSQLTGVLTRATLRLQLDASNPHQLNARVQDAEFSRLHARLAGAWDAALPEELLKWHVVPLTQGAFALRLRGGKIQQFLVEKTASERDTNYLRSVASALQLGVGGASQKARPNAARTFFPVMEESPMGACRTRYDVGELPTYIVQAIPTLAPAADLRRKTKFLDIVKTIDFDHCSDNAVLEWMPGGQAKSFKKGPVTRTATTRAVVVGELSRFELQSVVATSRVSAGTFLRDTGRESVSWGRVNLTLRSVDEHPGEAVLPPTNPINVSLIFRMFGMSPAALDKERKIPLNDQRSNGDSTLGNSYRNGFSKLEHLFGSLRNHSHPYITISSVPRYSRNTNFNPPSFNPDSSNSSWQWRIRSYDDENQDEIQAYPKSTPFSEQLQNAIELAEMKNELGNQTIGGNENSQDSSYIQQNSGSSNSSSDYSPSPRSLFQYVYNYFHRTYLPAYSRSSIVTNWDDFEKLFNSWKKEQEQEQKPNGNNRSGSNSEDGRGQSGATEQQYRDILDIETLAALDFDPSFAGVTKLCPEQVIVRLARQVADAMAEPGALVQQRALQRWGEMARLVRGCRHAQLTSIGTALQLAARDTDRGRSAWKAFRDATATAGTGASLMAVKQWLRTRVISDWEARQVVASLRSAARNPSFSFLNYFMDFIVDDDVIKWEDGVNTTTVMTLALLTFDVYVQGQTADYLVEFLANGMRQAALQNDTLRMQVYARALGMTGHPLALHAFAPFLNGLVPGTTIFVRVAMVVAIHRVALLHPKMVQKVLYAIFENQAEAYEVRVAAVYIIMCTRPTLAIMQRMAATAHLDPSNQVSSAVRTMLMGAAMIKNPNMQDVAQNARSVLGLLLRRTQSLHYSRSYRKQYFVYGKKGMGYTLAFNYVGSNDEIIPKLVYFGLFGYMGGLKISNFEFAVTLSSVSKLIETLIGSDDGDEVVEPSRYPSSPGLVNLGPRLNEPLEGHLFFTHMTGQQFVNFNKDTMYSTMKRLFAGALGYIFGKEIHNSKLFYGPRYSYAVPDITGHMVFFNFDAISLVRARGFIREVSQPIKGRLTGTRVEDDILSGLNFNMTSSYGNTMTSRFGFLCVYDEAPQRFVASYDQEYAYQLIVNASVGTLVSPEWQGPPHYVLSMQPMSDGKQKLLQFSSTPFTSRQSPDAQGPGEELDTAVVSARDLRERIIDFGYNRGFRFNITSEAEYMDSVQSMIEHTGYDFWSFFFLPIVHVHYEKIEASITFDPERAKMQTFAMDFVYTSDEGAVPLQSSHHAQQGLKGSNSVEKFGSRKRKVDIGTFITYQNLFDVYLIHGEYKTDFRGENETANISYIHQESNISDAKVSLDGSKTKQEMYLTVNGKWGEAPRWNFDAVLAADPTSIVTTKLSYTDADSKKMEIDMKCTLRRTADRLRYLRADRTAAVCRDQMRRGDLLLPACANITLRAGYLDHYRCDAEFERLAPSFANLTAAAYAAAREAFAPHLQENFVHRGEKGRASMDVRFKGGFHAVSVQLRSPGFASDFEDMRMTRLVRPFVVVHPQYALRQRLAQYLLVYQNEPKCVLDKNSVNTFDNSTYDVNLGPCWHNMTIVRMIDTPKLNLTIQARDIGEFRILRIILPRGAQLELQKPKTGQAHSEETTSMLVNGNEITVSKHKPISLELQKDIYYDFAELSLITGDLVLINLKSYGVRVIFDGVRILVYLPNSMRGRSLGLCGTFTGEAIDDFKDPDGYFQQYPRFFAASYADVHDRCEGHAKEDNALSKKVLRFPEQIMLFDVVGSSVIPNDKLLNEPSTKCSSKGIDVVKNGTKYCFSQEVLLKCGGSCQAGGYETRSVKYHCVSGSSARFWKSLVDRGLNPDFSRKPTSSVLEKKVPTWCESSSSQPRFKNMN